jgi:hypothetical protein
VKIAIVLQLACRKVLSMLSQPLKLISDKFMSEFEDTENWKIPEGCTVGLYMCSWVKHAEATSWWPLTPCFSGLCHGYVTIVTQCSAQCSGVSQHSRLSLQWKAAEWTAWRHDSHGSWNHQGEVGWTRHILRQCSRMFSSM